jgi:hypothetical protein
MSGRASRRKGKTGELEVVAELARHGLAVRRTPNSGGLAWRGDLQGLEGFVVEVKRRETLSVPAWLRQAHAAARAGEVPVVMFRRSAAGNASQRAPDTLWHVIEPLESWAARVARERGHGRCDCGAGGACASVVMRGSPTAGPETPEPGDLPGSEGRCFR